jgi:hypothetical protein
VLTIKKIESLTVKGEEMDGEVMASKKKMQEQ